MKPNIKWKYLFLVSLIVAIGFMLISSDANAMGALNSVKNAVSGASGSAVQMGAYAALLALFIGSDGGCWFCSTYETLFDVMNQLSGRVSDDMSSKFLILLGVGLLFYLALKIGSTVVKLQEVDLMQFMGELFKHMGRAMIAAALLMGSIEMYQYLISPFLAYSIALSNELLVSMTGSDSGTMQKLTSHINDAIGLSATIPSVNGNLIDPAGSDLPFSNELKNQISGMIRFCSVSVDRKSVV